MNHNKNQSLVELGLQSPNELDSEYFENNLIVVAQNKQRMLYEDD